MRIAATILTISSESLPTRTAKIPAITGCKYKNVVTVDAFNSLNANGFSKYVANVAPTITNPASKNMYGEKVDQSTACNCSKPKGNTKNVPNKNSHLMNVIGWYLYVSFLMIMM